MTATRGRIHSPLNEGSTHPIARPIAKATLSAKIIRADGTVEDVQLNKKESLWQRFLRVLAKV